MENCRIILKPLEDLRIREGHPWVYNNEIKTIEGPIKSGEIAYVYDDKRNFIGKGLLNTASKIFVRILSRDEHEVIDKDFFKKIIFESNQMRKGLGFSNSYRILFGEADGIPGLIIDKYGDYLSVQILSFGIDLLKPMFIDILVEIFNPKGIYERSDASVRKKEGLELFTGTIYGEVPDEIVIKENHLDMKIDIKTGQKTGTFLDQQENHRKMKDYVENKTVLDCFSHIGGFGLHAASFGASSVACLDISEHAVSQIKHNAELNHLTNVTALKKDVFMALREYQEKNETFDVIVLDPPAFAKKREDTKKAYQGYKEINLQALKLINPGGTLVTCSCSHFMTPELFMSMAKDASKDSKRMVQMIDFWIQGRDHPMHIASDESLYLKCIVLNVKK